MQKNDSKKALIDRTFENFIECSNDWIWEVNAQCIYTYASPQVEKMVGFTPEEIVGKTPFDLMPADESARVSKIFMDAIKKGEPIVDLKNINRHKNGQQIVLETSGVPVFDAAGKVALYRGVDRDITKQSLAEQERQQLINELKILKGIIPICSYCKKIRDDQGFWNKFESYIEKHSEATFSHGICSDCFEELYEDDANEV